MAKKNIEPKTRQDLFDQVTEQLTKITEIDPRSLSRSDELSPSINFSGAVPALVDMLEIYKQLSSRDISRLPAAQLTNIKNSCDNFESQINSIRTFKLNTTNPGDACNNIIEQIRQSYDAIVNPLLLSLAFTATQATDYAKLEREARGCLTTAKAESDNLTAYANEVRTQADAALTAIKQQAAEAGVATNGQIFFDNATQHANNATIWMWATVILSIITLLIAIYGVVFALSYQAPNVQASIQYLVSKIILLSTLSFGIFWSSKNYRAQKHNETINLHRANALRTFKAFIEGTSDSSVKDAILLHAAQAAFAPRPTAYDSNDTDHQPISPVVEVFGKSLPKSGSPN